MNWLQTIQVSTTFAFSMLFETAHYVIKIINSTQRATEWFWDNLVNS